ncbi:MAG: bestrophin family ion channel [Cyanobacteria bacterium P01_H01_bin.121]
MAVEKRQWLREVLRLKGSVIPTILPRVLGCSAFGVLISWLHGAGWAVSKPGFANLVPSLVLGLLLVFRTNTAYDRFWEGRKIWGSVINTVRNLARQIWVFVEEHDKGDRAQKQAILRLTVAFAVAVKLHLRGEAVNQELAALVSPEQFAKLQTMHHPPLEIAFWINDYLNSQGSQGRIHPYQLTAMVELLNKLVDYLGACERILKTPLPQAYSIHLKQLLLIYCLTLPFQLVGELGWLTGISVGLISFTLLGIEEIGLEIENPFGHDPNDLPLDAICETMRRNIEELASLESGNSQPSQLLTSEFIPSP